MSNIYLSEFNFNSLLLYSMANESSWWNFRVISQTIRLITQILQSSSLTQWIFFEYPAIEFKRDKKNTIKLAKG